MTEQAFRDALKSSVGNTGLSFDRQMNVLARMQKEEKTVQISGKMKLILVMIVVLMLGATGAVASSWGMVDWNGEVTSLSSLETASPYMDSLNKQYKKPEKGQIITLHSIKPPEGSNSLGIASWDDNSDVYASSMAEIQAWVEEELDGFLPWPVKILAGYDQLKVGRVHYAVDAYGEYEMLRQEITEDGLFVRSYFALPDDQLYMDQYRLSLLNDEGDDLLIDVYLSTMTRNNLFIAEDVSRATTMSVDGFDQVVVIESSEHTQVALRKEFATYDIRYKEVMGYPDGIKRENVRNYDCLVIEITGQGSPADLLAIFGLTAK